ncbi:MAG TPA: hypothetical protein DEO49_01375 [Sutterella sp.]|nr:hypothetical protein [Sutterella sp.]
MTQPQLKRNPYGIAAFSRLQAANYVYVDKTRYIERLEQSDTWYPLIVRPRRFGKTLFTMMLKAYYDKAAAGDFERNFSGTYIVNHKTVLAGSYRVLSFDFSGIASSDVQASFTLAVQSAIRDFLVRYPMDDVKVVLNRQYNSPADFMRDFFSLYQAQTQDKIYVIIDEYDQFANELIATDKHTFLEMTKSGGFYKNFYAQLKTATTDGPVERVFITGVTTVSLDSLTSGFNIADDISNEPDFVGMFGFTDDELRELIPQLVDLKKLDMPLESAFDRMKTLYNGYRFSPDSDLSVFNASMCLYYLKFLQRRGREPDEVLDPAFAPDLGKIHSILSQGKLSDVQAIVEAAVQRQPIGYGVLPLAINLHNKELLTREDLLKLLISFGFLTYRGNGKKELAVPNIAVAKQFFEYYLTMLHGFRHPYLAMDAFVPAFSELKTGNPEPFVRQTAQLLSERSGSHVSSHLSESVFEAVLCSIANFSGEYEARAEEEVPVVHKFADLILRPRDRSRPAYLFELKYLSKSEASEANKDQKWQQAREQLEEYAQHLPDVDSSCLKRVRVLFVWLGVERIEVL